VLFDSTEYKVQTIDNIDCSQTAAQTKDTKDCSWSAEQTDKLTAHGRLSKPYQTFLIVGSAN